MARGSGQLQGVLEAVAERIRKFADRRPLGEQNTKASLIEPILEALTWDVRDPDEVHREFRHTGKDSPVDYALKLNGTPRVFVEAKGLGETLDDRRWVAQVLGYATVAGVGWCVLTNGDEYRIYNAGATIDADGKLLCAVRLTGPNLQETLSALQLLSRSNLEQNRLERAWLSHFVDRRVKTALLSLLSPPTDPIIRLVRKSVANVKSAEVAVSLRRLDIRVEMVPLVSEEDDVDRPAPARTVAKAKNAGLIERRSRSAIEVIDLIRGGHLKAPLQLHKRYKGKVLQAKVLPNGAVSFGGKEYSSPSSAAEVARGTVTGRRMNTNGWTFWQWRTEDGKEFTLDTLRQRALSESPSLRLVRGEDRRASGGAA